jgi:hypothetical protein
MHAQAGESRQTQTSPLLRYTSESACIYPSAPTPFSSTRTIQPFLLTACFCIFAVFLSNPFPPNATPGWRFGTPPQSMVIRSVSWGWRSPYGTLHSALMNRRPQSRAVLFRAGGDDSWEMLQQLVERHSQSRYASTMWVTVAEAILAAERRANLPEWLLSLFQVLALSLPSKL